MNKDLIWIIPVIILTLILALVIYNNDNLRETNEKLKKEKFECKQELSRLKDKELERIVSGK